MKETDVREAAKLLKTKDELKKVLEKDLIRSINTSKDWSYGSAVCEYRNRMNRSRRLAQRVAEQVMRVAAEDSINDIDRRLIEMGMGYDPDE